MHLLEGLSPNEKRVLLSTFIAILLLLVFVNIYDFSSFGGSENEIGTIADLTNNTRVKSKKRVLWQNARKSQGVHVGDKIFTGKKSTATVKLGKTGSFSLGENSLVEFQVLNKEKLANFKNGTYRLFSNGKLRVAINGKMAEIDAENSEFEIVVNGTNNIQIKTVSGGGQIKINDRITQLKVNTPPVPVLMDSLKASPSVVKSADIKPFSLSYNPKLYDEYARQNGTLVKKPTGTIAVKTSVRLPIPTSSLSESINIQHSNTDAFASNYEHKVFGFDKKINKVFLGENFWRYGLPDSTWSDTYTFNVQKEYPAHSKPELVFGETSLVLVSDSVEGQFSISTPYTAIGYIVETSRTGDFENNSQLSWQKSKTVSIQLKKTGALFFRARSVDKEFRLSEWSDAHSFNVTPPPELKPIVLTVSPKSIRLGESAFAQWEPQSIIKKYRFQVTKGNKKVLSVPIGATSSDWFPQTTGTFNLSVSATDEFGRSVESNIETVTVAEPYVLTKVEPPQTRETASEDIPEDAANTETPVDVSTTVDVTPKSRNRLYTHSFLTLATSHLSAQSKPLNDASGNFAQSALLSADYLAWFNRHGLQGIVQKSILPLSDGIEAADILIGEARYRYRFTPSNFNNLFRSFQFTGFLGYEFYKNGKDSFLLGSYNFYKAGLTLDIPMFDRFVLAGIAAYGMQSSAFKYEASWDLIYFLQERMGIGFGYKLNFVEFDLTSEFPGYAPYREGYAQGVLSFRYFF